MARIESDYDIAGRYGNLVVYQVGYRLYARTRSSLDGKRFQKDPAFANSREKSKQFGKAATLAKEIYSQLPKEVKRHGLFGKLTGLIHQGLQEGKSREAIIKEVQVQFGKLPTAKPTQKAKGQRPLLKKNQPHYLSKWQVTSKGRLLPFTASGLGTYYYRHKAAGLPVFPDG